MDTVQDNIISNSAKRIVPEDCIRVSSKFAALNRLTTRDLNNNTNTPKFSVYSRDDIQKYISNPYQYEKQLRDAIIYIYGASSHFRRLIQYFVGLSDLSYIVEPYRIDPKKANKKTINNNYRKSLNFMSAMSVRTQFPKILTKCLREDVCYLTTWITNENITLQILPSDYCAISTVEGNVPNVTFNFSFFDSQSALLPFYPPEFTTKYAQYQKNRTSRWIELDSPTSFAIKCNTDILDYPLPPFAGLLRELYDIEDYAQLKSTKTALENYAMLSMLLPMDKDGNWGIDLDKAKEFWSNLDSVLPEEIGSVLSPMEISKIDFDRSHTGDVDTVADAEQHMFTAAGVSSLLFNNERASGSSLLLSIKADQSITYGIVKSIEDAINRLLQAQSFGKNFRVTFLDVSTYNRKEAGEAYLKAATYGLPTISAYAASQGIGQEELDSMSFLEGDVLDLPGMFKQIRNSTQMSSEEAIGQKSTEDVDSKAATDEGGAPVKDIEDTSDSREDNKESE